MTPAQINMLIYQSMITDEAKAQGINKTDSDVLWLGANGYLDHDINPTAKGWNELKSHAYKGYEKLRLECGMHVSIRPPLCAQTTPLEQEVDDLLKRVKVLETANNEDANQGNSLKICFRDTSAGFRKRLDALEGLAGITQEVSPKKEIEPGFYRVGQWSIFKKPMICVYANDDGALKYYYTGMDRNITYDVSQLDEISSLTPIKWVDA